MPGSKKPFTNSVFWFRKALRLHDNPALLYALQNSENVYPVFILDPHFVKEGNVGANRWRFLFESLHDLDNLLKKKNSALILLRGQPGNVLEQKLREWKIDLLAFEGDTEPYAKIRDLQIEEQCQRLNVEVHKVFSHTLYNPNTLYHANGNEVCTTYTSFLNLVKKVGDPPKPVEAPEYFPKIPDQVRNDSADLPTCESMNVEPPTPYSKYPGGETEALKRMKEKLSNARYICTFQKPQTSPNSLNPSTTVLSPYIKFGNLSARLFYWNLKSVYTENAKKYELSKPPESLEGQMLWREFFYFVGAFTPNFSKMQGNPLCRQINWETSEAHLDRWRHGMTGYPFIDAIMRQLKLEGWIHHLARHAVACFLTRGDLYISWERGQEVFESFLLDADWSLNAANWQWLSASTFFNQYWRVYSPIVFGKKTDPEGDYIRKYVPELAKFPNKFIYEPWTAPIATQKAAGCIIGTDYPKPIVDHAVASKANMAKIKAAFEGNKANSEPKKKVVGGKRKIDDYFVKD